jgi:subtilisin-like proprotein convertase family protein
MGMQAIGRWLGEPKKVALLLLAAGLAAVAALGLASAASAVTFSNDNGITINDASETCTFGGTSTAPGTATPYPSVIEVSGLGPSVTDVNVTVTGLTHGWPDDIGLLLVSPEGQSVILMTDSGGGSPVSNITLTFDDAASDPVPNTALVSGTYLPDQGTSSDAEGDCVAPESFPDPAPASPYGSLLSDFNGTNPNGDWKLYVIDDASALKGSITGWSLDISTTTAEDTTPPTVTNKSPDGTDPVSRTATVTASFSEEVQNVTSSTFILERHIAVKKSPPKFVLVDATVEKLNPNDPDDLSWVLKPVQDLPKGTYRATITTEVTDVAGNALDQVSTQPENQPKVWTFTVAK